MATGDRTSLGRSGVYRSHRGSGRPRSRLALQRPRPVRLHRPRLSAGYRLAGKLRLRSHPHRFALRRRPALPNLPGSSARELAASLCCGTSNVAHIGQLSHERGPRRVPHAGDAGGDSSSCANTRSPWKRTSKWCAAAACLRPIPRWKPATTGFPGTSFTRCSGNTGPACCSRQALPTRTCSNMTDLAIHFSRYVNGVAMRHGEVSQHMFPQFPIHAITNGVHAATWASPQFQELFDREIPEWRRDNAYMRYAVGIPARGNPQGALSSEDGADQGSAEANRRADGRFGVDDRIRPPRGNLQTRGFAVQGHRAPEIHRQVGGPDSDLVRRKGASPRAGRKGSDPACDSGCRRD